MSDGESRRFSDAKLEQLEKDFNSLRENVKGISNKLDKHIEIEEKKFDSMIDAVNENTNSIKTLTSETKEIVQLHRDLSGAARVGKGMQGFMLWLIKWGTIGVAIAAFVNWSIKFGGNING